MMNLEILSKPSSKTINKLIYSFIGVGLIGFIDAVFLTVKHYQGTIGCSVISGCQSVLDSSYSTVFGVPVALMGVAYYLSIIIIALLYIDIDKKIILKILSYFPITGFVFSIWLVYLQFFVINAICQYCMLSALTSITIFILAMVLLKKNK